MRTYAQRIVTCVVSRNYLVFRFLRLRGRSTICSSVPEFTGRGASFAWIWSTVRVRTKGRGLSFQVSTNSSMARLKPEMAAKLARAAGQSVLK